MVRAGIYKVKEGEKLVHKLQVGPGKEWGERITFEEEAGERFVVRVKLEKEETPVAFALRVTDWDQVTLNADGSGWITAGEAIIGQQHPGYFRVGKMGVFYRIGF